MGPEHAAGLLIAASGVIVLLALATCSLLPHVRRIEDLLPDYLPAARGSSAGERQPAGTEAPALVEA